MLQAWLSVGYIVLLTTGAQAGELPGDSAEGKRLHDANCLSCHDSSVYTRKDRQVGSLNALQEQLANCSHMAKKEFSAKETQDIVKYLNDAFYRFQ
jgi:mono/diheme cytochrome c family protein